LDVVDPHDAFAVNVDQLVVEHVLTELDLALATRKGRQIKDVRADLCTVQAEVRDICPWDEEISPPVTRDEAYYGRILFLSVTHDDVADRCDLVASGVKDRAIYDLGQIQHRIKIAEFGGGKKPKAR
jgi:hypothetical protein